VRNYEKSLWSATYSPKFDTSLARSLRLTTFDSRTSTRISQLFDTESITFWRSRAYMRSNAFWTVSSWPGSGNRSRHRNLTAINSISSSFRATVQRSRRLSAVMLTSSACAGRWWRHSIDCLWSYTRDGIMVDSWKTLINYSSQN